MSTGKIEKILIYLFKHKQHQTSQVKGAGARAGLGIPFAPIL